MCPIDWVYPTSVGCICVLGGKYKKRNKVADKLNKTDKNKTIFNG